MTLFDKYGVELEYVIVDYHGNIVPAADMLFEMMEQDPSEFINGPVTWTNELSLHVLEFRTSHPSPTLDLTTQFQENVDLANAKLAASGCKLFPSGMHPWMNPEIESKLWQHEMGEIYSAYDVIFGTKGHGWRNVQSTHLNLPFDTDEEFRKLHSALRLILPLIPALSASTPYYEGEYSQKMDARMEFYRRNQEKIPLVSGLVVPDVVKSKKEYEKKILSPLYDAISPYDNEGVLRYEWLNSRGITPRFERGSIEVRVIDSQECVGAEIAIVSFVSVVAQQLCEGVWANIEEQEAVSTENLHALLLQTITDADEVRVPEWYAQLFGLVQCSAGEFWEQIAAKVDLNESCRKYLEVIFEKGPLARRLYREFSDTPSKPELHRMVKMLCSCLAENRMF